MRPCADAISVLVLLALCCTSGCRLPFGKRPESTDPFLAQPAPGATATPPAPVEPPGVSVPKNAPSSTVAEDGESKGMSLGDSLAILAPTNIVTGVKNMTGFGVDETVAREAYAEADALFRERNYVDAASKYKKAARRYPDSILEEDAMFMQAESLFFADRYAKASDIYANLCKKYENSRYLDKITARQFSIGRYWEEQAKTVGTLTPNFFDKKRPIFDPRGNAIGVYESIRLNDPTGPLADDAVMATATQHFLNGKYEDADYYYSLLRKEYPRSEHQQVAHLVGIQAKMQAYQGAQYSETPLVEAAQLIDTTMAQFGEEMVDERKRLLEARNSIRIQEAEREWVSGEYYYRRKQYRAAGVHYNYLANNYPETEFAAQANQRLTEIKGLPPDPPTHFAWLGWIFGERPGEFKRR